MIRDDIQVSYWKKLLKNIIVPGESRTFPSEGEILCAFNELKSRRAECRFVVTMDGKKQGSLFQQNDKIEEITIQKSFDSMYIIELMVNFQATVRLKLRNGDSFSFSATTIDLQRTLENLETFVDEFPEHKEKMERAKIEAEKKAKIEEMAKISIRSAVEQLLSTTHYEWDLVDKGEFFSLRIGMGKKNVISMSLNRRDFMKRLPTLLEALGRVENLLSTMPFPMDITMTKEFVRF